MSLNSDDRDILDTTTQYYGTTNVNQIEEAFERILEHLRKEMLNKNIVTCTTQITASENGIKITKCPMELCW